MAALALVAAVVAVPAGAQRLPELESARPPASAAGEEREVIKGVEYQESGTGAPKALGLGTLGALFGLAAAGYVAERRRGDDLEVQ